MLRLTIALTTSCLLQLFNRKLLCCRMHLALYCLLQNLDLEPKALNNTCGSSCSTELVMTEVLHNGWEIFATAYFLLQSSPCCCVYTVHGALCSRLPCHILATAENMRCFMQQEVGGDCRPSLLVMIYVTACFLLHSSPCCCVCRSTSPLLRCDMLQTAQGMQCSMRQEVGGHTRAPLNGGDYRDHLLLAAAQPLLLCL